MKINTPSINPTNFRSVIVMPNQAKSLQEARDKMQESKDVFESLGVSDDIHPIMKSAAMAGKLTPAQCVQLEDAGFQVLEDKIVTRGGAKSVKDLGPGWFLKEFPFSGGPFDPFAPLRPQPRQPVERPRERRASSEGPSEYIGELSATGRGVTIAVLDTGVAAHPDLKGRLLANVSAVAGNRGYSIGSDPVGHGTHVAGDAAGDGSMSGGRLKGPAPEANIVGIQVLAEGADPAPMSQILEEFTNGVEWMIDNKEKYGIRVANMSLGFPLQLARDRYTGARFLFDPIGAAISQAVKSGIVVVAAAGNDGPHGQIDGSPGMLEEVITVGALDTNGTPGYKGDDFVAEFSSRGLTPDGRMKPDVIAPGVNILSTNSPGSMIAEENAKAKQFLATIEQAGDRQIAAMARRMVRNGSLPYDALNMSVSEFRELLAMGVQVKDSSGRLAGDSAYLAMDGTSMATPIVAGVVADMLEVNPNLSPAQVKAILMKTADPLRGEPRTAQGAGAIDAQEAIEWARRLKA